MKKFILKSFIFSAIFFGMGIFAVLFIKAWDNNTMEASDGDVLTLTRWNDVMKRINKNYPQESLAAGTAGTEQDTGTRWIDGKTIYRKVIHLGYGPNGGTKSVPHGITNLSTVVDYSYIYSSSTPTWQKSDSRTANSYGRIDTTNVNMYSTTGTNFTASDFYVIMYYTKN